MLLTTRPRGFLRRSAAFSLVEQLVGMSVLGIAITGLFAAFAQGFSIVQIARENLRATQILTEKTETVRLYTMEQLTNNNYSGTNFLPRAFSTTFYPSSTNNPGVQYSGTTTLTNAPFTNSYSSNLIQIVFEVTWPSSGVNRRRSMSTLVARDGLQSYIY